MSRIGKMPIAIPAGVKVAVANGMVHVEGPGGKLSEQVPDQIQISVEGSQLILTRENDGRIARAIHGLTRKLIANMVQGVSQGFARVLEITGVGYRAEVKDRALHLTLGYSHPVIFPLPESVSASVERQTVITLRGPHRQVLGETAARIRALKPPEPYKGKGIKYQEEVIQRKAGKAVGGAGTR